jgi:hypothetical protein
MGFTTPPTSTLLSSSWNFFAGSLGTGINQVCGTLCPKNVITNVAAGSWLSTGSSIAVQAGYGGTVTFTPQ